jgi:hypothetical protein
MRTFLVPPIKAFVDIAHYTRNASCRTHGVAQVVIHSQVASQGTGVINVDIADMAMYCSSTHTAHELASPFHSPQLFLQDAGPPHHERVKHVSTLTSALLPYPKGYACLAFDHLKKNVSFPFLPCASERWLSHSTSIVRFIRSLRT